MMGWLVCTQQTTNMQKANSRTFSLLILHTIDLHPFFNIFAFFFTFWDDGGGGVHKLAQNSYFCFPLYWENMSQEKKQSDNRALDMVGFACALVIL